MKGETVFVIHGLFDEESDTCQLDFQGVPKDPALLLKLAEALRLARLVIVETHFH